MVTQSSELVTHAGTSLPMKECFPTPKVLGDVAGEQVPYHTHSHQEAKLRKGQQQQKRAKISKALNKAEKPIFSVHYNSVLACSPTTKSCLTVRAARSGGCTGSMLPSALELGPAAQCPPSRCVQPGRKQKQHQGP